jgi:hypothetical protein
MVDSLSKDKPLPWVAQIQMFAVAIALMVTTGARGPKPVYAADASLDAAAASPTVKPNPLNFAAQSFTSQAATSATETIKVSNPKKGATITFSNINPTQPDFTVTGGTCQINATLAPGDSCTILVTFKPIQAGHRQATLFVEWGGNQVKVKVHLDGVANAPKLSISPTKLNFGSQPTGVVSSVIRTVTLKNKSPVAILISGTIMQGSYLATGCAGPLNPGAKCTLTVSTMPICPGKSAGTMRIVDDAASSPQPVALSVAGIAEAKAPGEEVLLAGGMTKTPGGTGPTNAAEVFNSSSCSSAATTGMTVPRTLHTETYLDPSIVTAEAGDVLITGGQIDASGTITNTAELYDPITKTFTATTAPMIDPRAAHTATLIREGKLAGMVLIAGGITTGGVADGTSELYDPATASFTASGSLIDPRGGHAADQIIGCGPKCAQEGDVIVAGGRDSSGAISSAEVFDQTAQAFSCVGGLSSKTGHCNVSLRPGRNDARAEILPNGFIAFIGGNSAATFPGTPLAQIELYHPAISAITAGPIMSVGRDLAALAEFPAGPLAGQVLITGGANSAGTSTNTAEIFNQAHSLFSCVQGVSASAECNPSMTSSRAAHRAISFDSGPLANMVLLAGGINFASQQILSTAEVFNPATASFQSVPGMKTARSEFTATVIPLP